MYRRQTATNHGGIIVPCTRSSRAIQRDDGSVLRGPTSLRIVTQQRRAKRAGCVHSNTRATHARSCKRGTGLSYARSKEHVMQSCNTPRIMTLNRRRSTSDVIYGRVGRCDVRDELTFGRDRAGTMAAAPHYDLCKLSRQLVSCASRTAAPYFFNNS